MYFEMTGILLTMIFFGIGIAIFALGYLGDRDIRKTYLFKQ